MEIKLKSKKEIISKLEKEIRFRETEWRNGSSSLVPYLKILLDEVKIGLHNDKLTM